MLLGLVASLLCVPQSCDPECLVGPAVYGEPHVAYACAPNLRVLWNQWLDWRVSGLPEVTGRQAVAVPLYAPGEEREVVYRLCIDPMDGLEADCTDWSPPLRLRYADFDFDGDGCVGDADLDEWHARVRSREIPASTFNLIRAWWGNGC